MDPRQVDPCTAEHHGVEAVEQQEVVRVATVEFIRSLSPGERVITLHAEQRVVPRHAFQGVGAVVTGQHVAPR